jgi:sugar-specific transcriptional regulator TrmB
MLKELQDLGLSEKEARVYLASLELGQTTAEKLATAAKVNRSTTYVQIESLMKVGLMSTHEEGKKTVFAPESPELLKRLLLKQKDQLQSKERDLANLLPTLLQQFQGAGERPLVRFFPGKEGIIAVREEVLCMRDKKLAVILSSESMMEIFKPSELDGYTDRRVALGISSRAIYTKREYFDKALQDHDELTEHRFLPSTPLTIDIRVFDDKTALFSLEGNLFALVIESKQIASSMRNIFEFLWKGSELPKNGK